MTASLPYRFGISQFTTWPWSFEQDVDNYARLGVDDIEVCEDKLDEDRAADQLALVGQQGLTISSVQPAVRTLFPSRMQPEPKDLQERTERFRRTIERVGRFAPDAPFVSNTGPPPNGNVREVFDVAAREYRALADFAEAHGVRLALEPLNPALMNLETAIWTLEQAMRIVTAVDHDSFGVCLDTWNVWQNADVAEAIKACGGRIFVVQVSDWRTPRSLADRHIVGQGEIPLPALIRAIHASGYRGAYVLEIFSSEVPDSLWDADLSRVVSDSRIGLEKAWREAVEFS
ncbi:MAG TPA: sugar phosphate isomerase/epimerase family protein [Rubrobacteraceae bacterium]|nr:sugar phosphate isomerase/epimerase family protein [Rubrobacteraceae bacterium]